MSSASDPAIAARFLTDGEQTAESVAESVAGFLEKATASLEIAIYDMRLSGAAAERVLTAVHAAVASGVAVRVVFNQDHAKRQPDPPPPEVDWDFLRRLNVPFHPVSGVPDLMHQKYVVRDAGTPSAAVLTGSTNWTDDSWTREENVLVSVRSADIAAAYLRDFEELWRKRDVAASGHFNVEWVDLEGGDSGRRLRVFFPPGRGPRLVHEMAHRIALAQRRVRICSPVLTAGPILATLAEMIGHTKADIRGVYDLTQMLEVQRQWSEDQHATWKLEAFRTVDAAYPFGAKVSVPYSKGSVHNFMHAKILVVDDTVFVGSYNLSHSGEQNAENVLEIESPALAETFADYADKVAAKYPKVAPEYPKAAPVDSRA